MSSSGRVISFFRASYDAKNDYSGPKMLAFVSRKTDLAMFASSGEELGAWADDSFVDAVDIASTDDCQVRIMRRFLEAGSLSS